MPDDIRGFILHEMDACGLAHQVFAEQSLNLVVRSTDGVLRYAVNLCRGSLIEAVRAQSRTVELTHVNRVLTQPHWRRRAFGR